MSRRKTLTRIAAAMLLATVPVLATHHAAAQSNTVKVGLILFLTGPFASTGRQLEAGAPDQAKRVAQELIVNDKVSVLGGFSLTPLALAVAPLATQSKTPAVVFVAATSSVIDASPYFIRSSFTLPQVTIGVAEWAPRNGIKKVVTLVSDYGPGIDAETAFKNRFTLNGGQVQAALRVPFKSPDFAPFLQRVRDEKPMHCLFFCRPASAAS